MSFPDNVSEIGELKLTNLEQKVYSKLLGLAGKIGNPEDINSERLFLSVLKMCDVWNIVPSMEDLGEGDEIAIVMKSLISKGLVISFEIEGLPSYIPLPYSTIKKSSTTEIHPPKIN